MTIAVLVKVVPELEGVSYDPQTRTMRRGGAPLVLNPFDLRAVLVSLSLRRHGERVVVVSMGPKESVTALSECLALGADEVVLITDRVLAGSDTLVTATVLAAALRKVGADLVLAGKYSVDSSTGQLASQLSSMLGVPMVDGALGISRLEGAALEVIVETERDRMRYHTVTPSLITVGEKIVKVRHPSDEEIRKASSKRFSVLGISDLALDPKDVGLAGSPTVVVDLADEEPVRTTLLLKDGTPRDIAERASARVVELLTARVTAPCPFFPLPSTHDPEREALVFASPSCGGLEREALPMMSEMSKLGNGLWVSAIGFGSLTETDELLLRDHGVSRCYWWKGHNGYLTPDSAASLVGQVLSTRRGCSGMLFLSESWQREVSGRVSGARRLGLIGDAVRMDWVKGEGFRFKKPSFGGGLMATVVSRTSPAMATMRPGSFSDSSLPPRSTDLELLDITCREEATQPVLLESRREVDGPYGDLSTARVIVGVGMGIGGPGNLRTIAETIRPLHAALGASRRVVDAGWLPHQLQIGLTGRFVAPDIYIAVGIKGRSTHMVGVKRAKVTIGINANPTDPLLEHVDVGLVGRWEDLLEPLVTALTSRIDRE